VEFNGLTDQVSAQQTCFAASINPQNLNILLEGARVVVEAMKCCHDDPLPEFPTPLAGTIAHKKCSENGELLVGLNHFTQIQII
jgi:hypothetical protein